MKSIVNVSALILGFILLFGFILPTLISSTSNELVLGGFSLLIVFVIATVSYLIEKTSPEEKK
jgi:hypothetical protein